jgi:hypothetical protein
MTAPTTAAKKRAQVRARNLARKATLRCERDAPAQAQRRTGPTMSTPIGKTNLYRVF